MNRREMMWRSAAAAGFLVPSFAAAARDFSDLYNPPPGGIDNSRVIAPAPPTISTNGRLNLGAFDAPVRDMNLTDSAMFGGIKGAWRRARMQQFIGYSFESPDWHVGIIVIDARVLSVGGLYLLNMKTQEMFQYECFGKGPGFRLARCSYDDQSFARGRGFEIEFEHRLDSGLHRIRADVSGRGKKPAVKIEVDFHEDLEKIQPLVVSLPVEPHHYFYTHKVPAPVSGSIRVGDDVQELDPARDTGNMDEHRNYYPVPNCWLFGAFTGRDKKGRLISVNMCDNAIRDQEHWNENCLWVDGKISLLGPIAFEVDLKNPMQPWRMKEKYGRLELEMTPDGGNEPFNIPPLGFKYYQKCGPYRGHLIDDAGRRIEVEGVYGEAEDFEFMKFGS